MSWFVIRNIMYSSKYVSHKQCNQRRGRSLCVMLSMDEVSSKSDPGRLNGYLRDAYKISYVIPSSSQQHSRHHTTRFRTEGEFYSVLRNEIFPHDILLVASLDGS